MNQRLAEALRDMQVHGNELIRLRDEALARVPHPSMRGLVLSSYAIALLEDVAYQADRMLAAADEIRAVVGRRRTDGP